MSRPLLSMHVQGCCLDWTNCTTPLIRLDLVLAARDGVTNLTLVWLIIMPVLPFDTNDTPYTTPSLGAKAQQCFYSNHPPLPVPHTSLSLSWPQKANPKISEANLSKFLGLVPELVLNQADLNTKAPALGWDKQSKRMNAWIRTQHKRRGVTQLYRIVH